MPIPTDETQPICPKISNPFIFNLSSSSLQFFVFIAVIYLFRRTFLQLPRLLPYCLPITPPLFQRFTHPSIGQAAWPRPRLAAHHCNGT
ncbi:hypothetical protein Leryth_009515 [Lithospermum erythrorhizon]|nr:hypothetical protein Leryth_009515 [Lithospermum erythrorhizon]